MAGHLNHPAANGFVPPYPVTPPATPTPLQPSYFQSAAPSSPPSAAPSSSSSSVPPPRPPKLPNSPVSNPLFPPLPPRAIPHQHHYSADEGKPTPPPKQPYHTASTSLPKLPLLAQPSDDQPLRRKSDEQSQRWLSQTQMPQMPPSIPPGHGGAPLPPPPPPQPQPNMSTHNLVYAIPNVGASQATLPMAQSNGEARRQKARADSKTAKSRPHFSEMERLRRTKNATRSRLRILSLDGGGIRGYSTLLLLEALMHDIFLEIHGREPRRGEDITKPCEVFDLIGGTGTGGLIAVMLGRLRMSVQTCKDVYTRMTRYVFETDKRFVGIPYGETLYKASKLERAIRTVVYERTKHDHLDLNVEVGSDDEDWDLEPSGGLYDDDEKELERRMSTMGRTDSIREIAEASRIDTPEERRRLRYGNAEALMHDKRKGRCKTMVTAVYKGSSDNSTPAIFRTYSSGVESMSYPDCRIWQAGRATCATLAAFKPVRIRQDVFLDEGTGRYNPTPTILEEACINEWPGREVGLVVSLGTGKRPQGALKGDNKAQWWENLGSLDQFTQARRRLMAKIDYCETIHQHVLNEALAQYGISKNRYFRLNVDTGVGEVALNEWSRLSEVSTATRVYLSGKEVGSSMKECARRMAKLTRDKWRKKVASVGGIVSEDKKAQLVGPDGAKMGATANSSAPTVYYEMPGDAPTAIAAAVNPPHGATRENIELQNQQLERMFGGNREQQEPAEMAAAPRIPAIRITPPSVRRPAGQQASSVNIPAGVPE